jgi:transglutaminase/protease-like cytokinesis protein 3
MKSFAIIVLIILCYGLSARAQMSDFCDTDFSKADSVAELYAAHSLADLKGLADKLTTPLPSEQEKFRAIYKWVCSNIEVDYALVSLQIRKRSKFRGEKLNKWNIEFNHIVFKTLLRERRTICTGYAYVVRELAFHAGLPCEIINGHAKPGGLDGGPRTVNHSWNVIQLNGKWYLCDATWSSGVFNRSTNQFVKKYNDRYFLTDPAVFSRDHDIGPKSERCKIVKLS